MTPLEVGALVVGVANVAGIAFLMKWLNALRGAVSAQQIALNAVTGLNKTALEVIQALDPERWAKEVRIHKDLADEKAAFMVEAERKRFEERRRIDMTSLTSFFAEEIDRHYAVMFRLLIQTPKHHRAALINGVAGLRDTTRGHLLKAAEELPDESLEGRMAAGIAAFSAAMQDAAQDLGRILGPQE